VNVPDTEDIRSTVPVADELSDSIDNNMLVNDSKGVPINSIETLAGSAPTGLGWNSLMNTAEVV